MSTWPLYRENLLQGPAHVSLAIPGIPSNISKSVGGTSPALLLIPNTDYLKSFVNGNVGIGDNLVKGMLTSMINSPTIASNESMVKSMAKSLGLNIPELSKYKDKTGKINIPLSDITVPTQFNGVGLQAVEKTIMTSIFETQKPFIEITKIVLGTMVNIEDIIARVMPLLALNPLTSKSERPNVKDGSSNGSKAIGYKGGLEFKKALAELEKISKKGSTLVVNKDGSVDRQPQSTNSTKTDQPDISDSEAKKQGKYWKTISIVYSTGEFDPSVDYIYSYNILPSDEDGPNDLNPTPQDETNPYDKYKPKYITLGLFKSDGTPLDPRDKLNSTTTRAKWITDSNKWKFRGNDYIWPSFGGVNGTPIYLWEGPLGKTEESKTSPGSSWSIKRYKKGDKNLITKGDAIEGDPFIVRFDATDSGEYLKYFTDFVTSKAKVSKDLDESEKTTVISDVMSKVDVQSHLQNVFLYGSGPNSHYDTPIPETLKKSFKPYQIYSKDATMDTSLNGDGLVWVDPEADYDMKIIKVEVYKKDGQVQIMSVDSNNPLSEDKPLSTGIYGVGTIDNPQKLETIKRYALTDKDVETYYVIEGVLSEQNKTPGGETNANATGDDSSRWYRLPHAIGAIIPFLKLMVDLAIKLFPTINKVLKLFSNPTKLVTDIITEKLGESFDTFSKPSMDRFTKTKDIVSKKQQTIKEKGTAAYSNSIKENFQPSPLRRFAFVDRFSKSKPGSVNFILDGTAMIPFEIMGKSIPFGMELKMSNLIPEVPNINVPKVPQVDIPKIPNPNSGQTPTITSPNISVPNVGVPSITLPKVSSPFRLIVGKIGKAKTKDCSDINSNNTPSGQSAKDYQSQLNTIDKATQNPTNTTKSPNNSTIISTWYSTGSYINGLDYNYYYITTDEVELLKDVNELIYPGSSNVIITPNTTSTTSNAPEEDLQLAKEKLENALSKDPDNELLKSKLKEVKELLSKSNKGTQPILKLVLGVVAIPIKIISCIVQWILDFFKSLMNPMQLPSKIIEFLSFEWIMKFFSPAGLMKTFGINYNPVIGKTWGPLTKIPNPKKVTEVKQNLSIPSIPSPNIPNTLNIPTQGGIPIPKMDNMKNLSPHFGDWLLPDNFPIADLSLVMDIMFMPKYPTYNALHLRMNPKIPSFSSLHIPSFSNPNIPSTPNPPGLCLIEKFINAFIDFVWSLLGIEAIIKPPHIKLCKDKTPSEQNKLQQGITKSDTVDATEIVSTNPYEEKPISDSFIYEVTFSDGKKEVFKDYESLQQYIDENKDINFDLNV